MPICMDADDTHYPSSSTHCTHSSNESPLSTEETKNQPTLVTRSRDQHPISRSHISPYAVKVLYRLHNAGFRACLVGGGVRDLLLQLAPKDFDVGTDATPEQVQELFRNCRLIGRRFRLAHVRYGREIIEVATFRASSTAESSETTTVETTDTATDLDAAGMIRRDNVYGTIEDDAQRRDFTINALYYDISDFSILDYTGGLDDIQAGLIRMVGDPAQRYREDPVRMLRAVRFAAKLDFRIHHDTEAPIARLAHLLRHVAPARLFEEVLKLLTSGHAAQTFEMLQLYGLFNHLVPLTARVLRKRPTAARLLRQGFINTDQRIAAQKPVTPAFLYAVLLWPALCDKRDALQRAGLTYNDAVHQAADEIIEQQYQHTALPRRFSSPMREIWALQPRFEKRHGKRAFGFLSHVRFRAAYDFLLLRAESGEPVSELAKWWTQIQTLPEQEQFQTFVEKKPTTRKPRRKRVVGSSDTD